MLYTVSYFNPLGNCDNIVHVEADSDKEAFAGEIHSSKYYAGGYWIPNWAIEWLQED